MSIELMNFEDDIKEDKPKVDRWINTLRLIKGWYNIKNGI